MLGLLEGRRGCRYDPDLGRTVGLVERLVAKPPEWGQALLDMMRITTGEKKLRWEEIRALLKALGLRHYSWSAHAGRQKGWTGAGPCASGRGEQGEMRRGSTCGAQERADP
eukprot:7782880-Pyramimonas_sp.AAC.1